MVCLRTMKVFLTKIIHQDFPLRVTIFKRSAVSNYLKLLYNAINVTRLKSQVTGQLTMHVNEKPDVCMQCVHTNA